MSDKPTCRTCGFWKVDQHDIGYCVRHAPSRPLVISTSIYDADRMPGLWPRTRAHDFCGEWTAEPVVRAEP